MQNDNPLVLAVMVFERIRKHRGLVLNLILALKNEAERDEFCRTLLKLAATGNYDAV